MAASMSYRRTAALCRAFAGVSLKAGGGRGGLVLPSACYNPRPLKLNLKEPYVPDRDSEKTPEWQKTAKYDRKLYGRYGSASGIDPATLWPSHEQLERLIEEEKQWQPSLAQMTENLRLKDEEETQKLLAREKLIADSMAKMPKLISDWRREKRETRRKQREEKEKRERLLALAKDRFGFTVDPRSAKFLDMVAEIEKEEKKRKKLIKRKQREEAVMSSTGPAPSSSPGPAPDGRSS